MVVASHVIAERVKKLVMTLNKNLRTASVVCVEQASDERGERIDAHDCESRYRNLFASTTHGVLSGLTMKYATEVWDISFHNFGFKLFYLACLALFSQGFRLNMESAKTTFRRDEGFGPDPKLRLREQLWQGVALAVGYGRKRVKSAFSG